MENKVEKYVHDEFGELDVMQVGDKFWFPATECAKVLGYANPKDAVLRHCIGDGVVKHDRVSTTTNQYGVTTEQMVSVKYIDEGNLYRLIIRSKLSEARIFEKWVFDTVLPSIRRHGAYIIPELLDELQRNTVKNAELLKDLAEEQRERIAAEDRYRRLERENQEYKDKTIQLETASRLLEETLEEAKPKISYYDTILQNPYAVPVTLIAKDYGMPAVRFNRLLHGFHIQYRVGGTWELYQEYASQGYTHGNVYYTKSGEAKVHTCWTQKGRLFLYEFLKERMILPKVEVAE